MRLLLPHHVNFNPARELVIPIVRTIQALQESIKKGKFFEVTPRSVRNCLDFPAQRVFPARPTVDLNAVVRPNFRPYGARAEGSVSRARATGAGNQVE